MVNKKNRSVLQEICSDLAADFECEGSSFKEFFDSLIVNTIFKELKENERVSFIKLLNTENKTHVLNFLNNKVPNLSILINARLNTKLDMIKKIGGSDV